MGSVITLENYQLPEGPGRHHRIICMTGEKRGEVYYLRAKRILLGRSKEADITLYDLEASKEHADLVRAGMSYIISDLNSNNGTIINGRKTRQARLHSSDRFIIGKTVYKYEIIDVDENESTGELVRSETEKEEFVEKESSDKKKKKGLMALVALIAVVFLTMEEETEQGNKTPVERAKKRGRFLQNLQQEKLDQEESEIDVIIRKGIRELREGNYYRAIGEFDLALIANPRHSRAIAYKKKANDLLDKEIENYFDQAARDFENFHYTRAVKNYCQIIKILEDYPEDERRKNAEDNLKQMVKEFGAKESATNCF